MKNTHERLRGLIDEYAGVDPEKITLESHLEDDLGLDSLDRIELMMAAEDEFGIEVSDDQTKALGTVQDAVRLIESKLA
jgi:acyl carrier protein